MNIETEIISSTRTKLIISVSKDEKAQARKKTLRKFVADSELKGYRKGKAPEALVATTYASEIASDALQSALETALKNAVAEKKLKVLEQVEIGDFKNNEGDESMSFSAVLDIAPEFELPQYEGIAVDGTDTAVSDDDVEKFLENLRKYRAKFEELAEGVAAAGNDFLIVSYEGFIDGKPLEEFHPGAGVVAKNEQAWCSIGSEKYRIPGLPQALAGATIGEERTVAVAFPDDYSMEALRGKNAEYKVTVKSGRREVLPELDEAFAKEAKFENLAALKDSVRKRLEIEAAQSDANRRRNQIANFLVGNASFEVPQAAYERGVQAALDQIIEQALRSGSSKEQIEEQRDKFLDSARKFVLGDMRLGFITRGIADALDITVSDDEYTMALNDYAAEHRFDSKQADEFIKRERQTRWLRSQTLRMKVLNALLAKATRTASMN